MNFFIIRRFIKSQDIKRTQTNLSSKSLFHFTSKEDFLIGILDLGFKPRYCLEKNIHNMQDRNSQNEMAFPMGCFCDIRLSQTSEHSKFYGKYVIGLKKEWGISKGVAPVSYYHNNSPAVAFADVCEDMNNLIMRVAGKNSISESVDRLEKAGLGHKIVNPKKLNPRNPLEIASILSTLNGVLLQISQFFKPIEGKMLKNGNFVPKYFYDEREWRFTPVYQAPYFLPYLTEKQFRDDAFRKNAQDLLDKAHKFGVLFSEDDITQILVPKIKDVAPFKEKLKLEKRRLNIDKIIDKIRSYEELENDH